MFDITSTKLLIIGVMALLVVGPKELPALLRTIGKYMGIIKRQAAEFRTQFDEAMRETELSSLKKDVETFTSDAKATLKEAEESVEKEMDAASKEAQATLDEVVKREEAAIASKAEGMGGPKADAPQVEAPPAEIDPFPTPPEIAQPVAIAETKAAEPVLSKTGA